MLAALTLLIAAGSVPAAKSVVALMPLRPLGVPAEIVHALEVTLRNELSQLPEAKLVPQPDLDDALQAQPGCASASCEASAALKAGAEELITGTTSQLGDSFTVDLKLVDARTARELRRVTYPVSGSQDALIEMLREAAVRLLAPSRYVGALRIDVPGAPGAQLFVDGKPLGALPLSSAIEGLQPGQHTVRVAAGSREMSTFVHVRFGETTEARIDLADAVVKPAVPDAALRGSGWQSLHGSWVRPAAIAGLGGAVAALAVGVVFHLKAYSIARDINQKEARNELQPGIAASYRDVDRDTNVARALYVTGAVLGLAGGGLLVWDLRGASIQGSF